MSFRKSSKVELKGHLHRPFEISSFKCLKEILWLPGPLTPALPSLTLLYLSLPHLTLPYIFDHLNSSSDDVIRSHMDGSFGMITE